MTQQPYRHAHRRARTLVHCCFALPLAGLLALAAGDAAADAEAVRAEDVAAHYVHLAHERYRDAAAAAESLHTALQAFLDRPSPQTHAAAKEAWIEAHSVYSHTEVFRFGNPNVDAWEPAVNAWPMDEGLIDYVDTSRYEYDRSNPHALENIIARNIVIDVTLLEAMRTGRDPKETPIERFTDVEANVVTGFHAIEFLLWGQDLNQEPGNSGQRPYTDYVVGEGCTHGHCKSRAQYLNAASRVLLRDFRIIINDWNPDRPTLYSKKFRSLPVGERLERMIVGMGSMSYGELAGERIRTALLAGHQEEEQSCFSDTTHLAIYHNAKGVATLYHGRHERRDGSLVTGPSLSDLVRQHDPELDARLQGQFEATMEAAGAVVRAAEDGEHFDRMIQADNDAGRARLTALIDALRAQTETIESIQARIDLLAAL